MEIASIRTDGATDCMDAANIAVLRADMLRFATLQLRDASAAEDAVQEALAAAFINQGRYAGRAQLKTWVFAILRNKIVDIIRERIRHPTLSYDDGVALDEELDQLFDERGYWLKEERPADWGRPEQEFENGRFWQVFDACMNFLPENTARVFMMREMLGLDTAEICTELAISDSNCWVILHRARSRLRLCLEENWFDGEKP